MGSYIINGVTVPFLLRPRVVLAMYNQMGGTILSFAYVLPIIALP